MRLLTRRLYRAFPELDRYTDEQCRRFMRSARRGRRILFGTVWLVVVLTGLGIAAYLGDYVFELANEYQTQKRQDIPELNLACYLVIGLFLAAPFGVALMVRDWMMRRRVRVILTEDSACPRCRYRLLGLALEANSTITCPECGLVSEVDPSLSELTLDESGKEQVRLVIVLPPSPPLWKRRGVRIAVRIAAVLILLLAIAWMSFFGWLARQTGAAHHAMLGVSDQMRTHAGTRVPAEAAGLPDSAELGVLLGIAAKADGRMAGNVYFGWAGTSPTLEAVLKNDGSPAQQLAVTMALAYGADGVFDQLRLLQSTARATYNRYGWGPYRFMIVPQVTSGSPELVGEINSVRLELARRSQNWPEFFDAVESNLALARILRHQDYGGDLLRACEIEAKTFGRVRAALADGRDKAWLDAVQGAIRRQRTDLPKGLVFEGDRLGTQAFVAAQYEQAVAGTNSFQAIRQFLTSSGYRLGSYAENRDWIDRYYKDFEAIIAQPPHARAPVVVQPGTDLGYVLASQPEQRYLVIEAFDRNLLERRSIDVLLALEQFKVKRGAYPAKLEELVPEFLAALPEDPWSGKAFGYKLTDPKKEPKGRAFLLYSTGFDKTDDGGAPIPGEDQEGLLKLMPKVGLGFDYIINPGPTPSTEAPPPAAEPSP